MIPRIGACRVGLAPLRTAHCRPAARCTPRLVGAHAVRCSSHIAVDTSSASAAAAPASSQGRDVATAAATAAAATVPVPAPAAAAAAAAARSRPFPLPVTQYRRKPRRHPDYFRIPPPARPTSEAEMEALKRQGYDGETYDMMACYQLGQLFFEGITPPKGARVPTPSPPPVDSDASPSFDAAAAADSAPWSLPKNYSQSLLWFTNAAFEGHVPSRTRLGVMYLAGYGIKRMVDIALQLFGEASEAGDRDAHAHLAAMHMQGMGTPKDMNKAIELYTKAAERGHVRAQAALAKLLDSPASGALRDPTKARHWLREAAAAQHAESQFLLAQRLQAEADHAGAFRWFMEAAKGGHAQAQYLVGQAHIASPESDPAAAAAAAALPDPAARLRAAARWFAQACEQGNVGAQARMGFMSYHGVGTEKDEATALMWLSNAAEANHTDAQLFLGSIAYDEHVRQQASGAPAPGSREEGKKLATARAYFDKVLENGNKQCTSLPSGALPLLVRMAQDASLPSHTIRHFSQITGQPWIGDINVLLAEVIKAQKDTKGNNAQGTTEDKA